MNTDEKLEQSCIVKERGTQYFKVSYSPQVIAAFLSPCHELIMMTTASVVSERWSWYSVRFYRESWRRMCLKNKKKLSCIIQRTNSAGSSLLELSAVSTDNTGGCTVFHFLLWDSAVNEQRSFG